MSGLRIVNSKGCCGYTIYIVWLWISLALTLGLISSRQDLSPNVMCISDSFACVIGCTPQMTLWDIRLMTPPCDRNRRLSEIILEAEDRERICLFIFSRGANKAKTSSQRKCAELALSTFTLLPGCWPRLRLRMFNFGSQKSKQLAGK